METTDIIIHGVKRVIEKKVTVVPAKKDRRSGLLQRILF